MEGVAAGHGARGAGVIAADVALGQLVKEEFAFLVEGFGGNDLTAKVAEVGEPVAEVQGELGVDLLAQALGEGGGCAGGGDGYLEVAAADDGREVEVAEGWVVDGVAEDVGGLGFCEDGAVDGGVVGCGDDEEVASEVAWGEGALMPKDFAGGVEFLDGGAGVGGDDGDAGVGGAEAFDLGFGEVACADDDARAGGELEKDGEKVHLPLVGLVIRFGGVPDGIRTRVIAVKGRCPRPLDDGDAWWSKVKGIGIVGWCQKRSAKRGVFVSFGAVWVSKMLILPHLNQQRRSLCRLRCGRISIFDTQTAPKDTKTPLLALLF